MYRLATLTLISLLLWAPQAFALVPLEEQAQLTASSQSADTAPVQRFRAPQSRTDRWRGAPYTRTEDDVLRREALDKRLVRSGELPVATTFAGEDDVLLRREALDKRVPVSDFGVSPPGVSFNEGDDALRREALDKRMPLPNFGTSPVPGVGF